jgi:hypothetical protein
MQFRQPVRGSVQGAFVAGWPGRADDPGIPRRATRPQRGRQAEVRPLVAGGSSQVWTTERLFAQQFIGFPIEIGTGPEIFVRLPIPSPVRNSFLRIPGAIPPAVGRLSREAEKPSRKVPTPLAGVEPGFVTSGGGAPEGPHPACQGGTRVRYQTRGRAGPSGDEPRLHPGKRGGGRPLRLFPSADEPRLHPGKRGGGRPLRLFPSADEPRLHPGKRGGGGSGLFLGP